MADQDDDADFVHHEKPHFDIQGAVNTLVTPLPPPKRRKGQRDEGYAKALREYDIRAKIQNSKQLDHAFKTIDEIDKIHRSIGRIKAARFTRGHQAKYSTMLAALKIKLDAHMRFLNKVVPDLKSVELSDPDGNGPTLTLRMPAAPMPPPIDGEFIEND